jgi:hypothetical protein
VPLRGFVDVELVLTPDAAAVALPSAMTGVGVPVARAIGSSSPRHRCRALTVVAAS